MTWRPYVEQADMIYSFGAGEIDGTTMRSKVELYERLAAACGKELMTTVYPGYYGAWLNGRNDFYQVHCGFDQAHHSFEAANTPKAKFLHYTTWNDHDETSLLPMVFTPANPLITRAYTARFKGESTVTGEPEVVFACHREELPGTLLRFEAMTLPTLEKGGVAGFPAACSTRPERRSPFCPKNAWTAPISTGRSGWCRRPDSQRIRSLRRSSPLPGARSVCRRCFWSPAGIRTP